MKKQDSQKSRSDQNKPKKGKVFLISLIVFTVLLILTTLLLTLPIFRIQQIELVNLNFIPAEDVLIASGIQENQHFLEGMGGSAEAFFQGRYQRAEENIVAQIPVIDSAKVSFSFPSKIKIEVTEKVEVGWINISGGYATVDSKGEIISILHEKPTDLPVVKGLTVTNAVLGKKIEVKQTEYFENAMYAMSCLIEADVDLAGEKLIHRITKIEPTINNDIYLELIYEDQAFTIICDKSHDLIDDFVWLKQLINTNVLAGKEAGIIDLRGSYRIFKEYAKESELNHQTVTEPEQDEPSNAPSGDLETDGEESETYEIETEETRGNETEIEIEEPQPVEYEIDEEGEQP